MSLSEKALESRSQPLLLVVMGVSGTGKSTLANEFARQSGFIYLDADSLHSENAIEQMSRGIPLTDGQRGPWIQRIYRQLCEYQAQNKSCILAYSGLKQQHRKVIFSAYRDRAGVLLHGEQGLIIERLEKRSDHFMSPQLLGSQIAEMEPFDQQVPLLKLDLAGSVEQLLLQMLSFTASLENSQPCPSNSTE
jgi:gluconokinase